MNLIVKVNWLEYAYRYNFACFYLPMSSDFVFINPNKIPPRRVVKNPRYGGFKRVSGKVWERDQDHEEEMVDVSEVPEFSLLNEVLPQTYLASKSADPLTQAIFGLEDLRRPKFTQPYLSRQPKIKKEPAFLSTEKIKPKTISREALLAELASIDSKDEELFKKIRALETPSRAVPISFAGSKAAEPARPESEVKINVINKKSFYTDFGEEREEKDSSRSVLALTSAQNSPDYHRAESDWFQVGLAGPAKISELKKYAEEQTKSHSRILRAETREEKTIGQLTTYLAFLMLTLLPLSAAGFLHSGESNFVKTAFNSFNARLLSTSSFTLINAEEGSVFPELVEIRSEIKNLGVSAEAVAT